MKEVPTFIKYIKEFFYKVRIKGKEGGRVYTRCLILYNLLIEDLIKIVKEEMSEIRLFIKPQAVMLAMAETIEWFIKLDLEIDIKTMQQFFREEVKKIVKFKPEFTLVVKFIFDSKKAQKITKSFMNKNDSRPKRVHVEVIREQALGVT